MVEETISQIEDAEKKALEKIEKEKKYWEEKLKEEEIKQKDQLENKKKQNITDYKNEIENFSKSLDEKNIEFKNLINCECLKFEENFKKNSPLAVSATVNEILKISANK